jgi:hypothetical protein
MDRRAAQVSDVTMRMRSSAQVIDNALEKVPVLGVTGRRCALEAGSCL